MGIGEPILGAAPQEVGQKIKPVPRKISRREFLKLAGVTLGGLALKPAIDATANIWQPKVVDLGIEALENPSVVESIISASASSLETLALRDSRTIGAPEITTNPAYKPMTKIIGGVLDQRRKEGKPTTYQRVAGYEELPYYINKVRKMANDQANRDRTMIESGELPASSYILGYMPGIFDRLIYDNEGFFPTDVKAIYDMSNETFNLSWDLVRNGSGFLEQIIEALGEESKILIKSLDLSDFEHYKQGLNYRQAHRDEIDQVVGTYLQDIKQHVETLVTQSGVPISAGEIFSYCLGRNNGSINKSLMDTMIFLKYMARNDNTLHTFDEVKQDPRARSNEDWFKINIKDEYGKVGRYSELPHETYQYNGSLSIRPDLTNLEVDKDLHLLNQIGKPYHAWNIVMLLVAVPPTLAQLGIAQRQLETFGEQGPTKTAADFRVALELGKLDLLFSQV